MKANKLGLILLLLAGIVGIVAYGPQQSQAQIGYDKVDQIFDAPQGFDKLMQATFSTAGNSQSTVTPATAGYWFHGFEIVNVGTPTTTTIWKFLPYASDTDSTSIVGAGFQSVATHFTAHFATGYTASRVYFPVACWKVGITRWPVVPNTDATASTNAAFKFVGYLKDHK